MINLSPVIPVVQRIAQFFRPDKIILFGSHAYGHPTPDSDYDLLIVLDTEEDPLWAAARISAAVDHPAPLDIVVKLPSDWARSIEEGNLFETEILTKEFCSMKPRTIEWIERAEGDWTMATRESQATNPIWNGICFLSQQSAEKYLKAYLEEAGTAFPKTHDLVVLLNLTGGVLTNLETMRADLAH